MNAIRLNKISKWYNGNKIIDNISLSFNIGEFVCILGPSGCGKTTLLNIIGLIEDQDSGSIYINNKKVNRSKKQKFRKNEFSYIYQNHNLVDYFSVEDNLSITNIDKEFTSEVINNLNCYEMLTRKTTNLSGGEKQKINIVRSLIKKPRIIIADEPTGSIDSKTSLNIMDILNQNRENKLIVMATHNIDLAKKYATRIIILENHTIISDEENMPTNKSNNFEENNNNFKLSAKQLINNNIKFLKTVKATPFLFSIVFTICLVLLSSSIGLYTGLKEYKNSIYSERLDSKYFEMSYIVDGAESDNSIHIENKLKEKGIYYQKYNNYSFLFNNVFYEDIKYENKISFDFDISVIDLKGFKSKIIPNTQFMNLYKENSFIFNKTENVLGEEVTFSINENLNFYNQESTIYNSPKIYIDYNYIETFFEEDVINYIFLQDEYIIPSLIYIANPIQDTFKILDTSEEFSSLIKTKLSIEEHEIIYNSSSIILHDSFEPLIETGYISVLIICLTLIVLSYDLFNVLIKNILLKRKNELSLDYAFGFSYKDIRRLIFYQNMFFILPSFILSNVLYYIIHKIFYFYSSKIVGVQFNLLEFEIKGIIAILYVSLIVCVLSSISSTNKSSINMYKEELRNE